MLITALMAGLLGSGHCLAMCGGIATSLGVSTPNPERRARQWAALRFNLARIASYALLGAVLAALAGLGGQWAGQPAWGAWLRRLSAILIALIGLQYLSGWSVLAFIERAGSGLWSKIVATLRRLSGKSGGQLMLGLAWGLLPCGLVYTMLLAAMSTGQAVSGATIMTVFGLGTLPSMLGAGLLGASLDAIRRSVAIRRMVGAGLILLAAWAFVLTLGVPAGHTHY